VICHFGLSFPKWGEPSMHIPFRLHSISSVISIPVMVSHRLIGMLSPVSGSTAIAKSSPSLNWALATMKVVSSSNFAAVARLELSSTCFSWLISCNLMI
jgi:hypothetical protein